MKDVLIIGAGPAGLLGSVGRSPARCEGTRDGEWHRHNAHFAGVDPGLE